MAIFDRLNIKIVAGAGLCAAAIALSTDAAAAPLIPGGACMRGQSGEVGAPALAGGTLAGAGAPLPAAGGPAAGGPVPAAGGPVPAAAPTQVCTTGAPLTDMA